MRLHIRIAEFVAYMRCTIFSHVHYMYGMYVSAEQRLSSEPHVGKFVTPLDLMKDSGANGEICYPLDRSL